MKKYTFTVYREGMQDFVIYAKNIQSAISKLKNVENVSEDEIRIIDIEIKK
jgi:hypothetical protein